MNAEPFGVQPPCEQDCAETRASSAWLQPLRNEETRDSTSRAQSTYCEALPVLPEPW
jgi:hypothetical protein